MINTRDGEQQFDGEHKRTTSISVPVSVSNSRPAAVKECAGTLFIPTDRTDSEGCQLKLKLKLKLKGYNFAIFLHNSNSIDNKAG